jgi:hypothetical protein
MRIRARQLHPNPGVSIRAGDAQGREQLLRYCARPTLSLERSSVPHDGRIAALLPPLRPALVRSSGVLAPASKWRPLVVPAAPEKSCQHDLSQPPTLAATAVAAKPNAQAKPFDAPAGAAATALAPTPPQPSGPASPSRSSFNPFAHVDDAKPPRSGLDKFRGRRSTSCIDWGSLTSAADARWRVRRA